jgi:hypothetical protein
MDYDLPNAEAESYLGKFNACVLYVIAAPDRSIPTFVGLRRQSETDSPERQALLSAVPGFRVQVDHVESIGGRRIAFAVSRRPQTGGPVDLDVDAAIAAIQTTASRYGAGLLDHDKALKRAEGAVSTIRERVGRANATGELKAFNER